MNKFISRFMGKGQPAGPSKFQQQLFDFYRQKNYKELRSVLKQVAEIGPQEFWNCREDEFTLLHHSVFEKDPQTVDLILKEFADSPHTLDHQENELKWTPLLLAAKNEDFDMAKKLIDSGATLLVPMEQGVNIFHMSAANNDVRLLDYVLKLKQHYSVDFRNEEGWTPLQHAGMTGAMDSINLLMEHGADPLERNDSGQCLFDHIISADHVELFEIFYQDIILREKNRDKNQQGSCGLIHRAAGANGPDCLEYYIAKNKQNIKSLIMQPNNEYEKSLPLHYAVATLNLKNIKTILKLMAQVGVLEDKQQEKKKKTKAHPQQIAFQKMRQQQGTQKLITSGINAQDSNGLTPLHLAVFGSSHEEFPIEVIKLLMKYGADPYIKNLQGETCVDVAKTEKNQDCIALVGGQPQPSLLDKKKEKKMKNIGDQSKQNIQIQDNDSRKQDIDDSEFINVNNIPKN